MNNKQNKTKTAPETINEKPVTKEELTAFLKKIKFTTFTEVDDLYAAIKKEKSNINFENPKVIKMLTKSSLPILKGLAARLAVLTKNQEIEELLLKEADPRVLNELVKTENTKTAKALSENKNLTAEMIDLLKDTIVHNISSKAPVVANRLLITIIQNPNVLSSTLFSIIYNTHNYSVLRNILMSDKLTSRMISVMISLNMNNISIIILALKSSKVKVEHFLYVISRSDNRRIIEFCSKQRSTEIIEFMASMNKGVELLMKNPYVTSSALFTIVRQNISNIELVQKVLLHRKVKNYTALWDYVLEHSNDQKIFDLLAASGNPLFRLKLAQSFSQKISDEAFKKLLKDPDSKVSDALKNHKDEKVRIRVSKLIDDKNYLLDKAVSSQSTQVKVAIAQREKLDSEVELGLLKNRNKSVYLAIARRTGDISTTAEEKLALTKDPEILVALSKRELIKSNTVLKLLATSGIEEVEMNIVKNSNNKSIHKMLIRETKSLKVANFILQNSEIDERIALAQKDFEIPLLRTLVLEILKDPEVRVRAALLSNKAFLDQLWNVIHRKNEQTNTNPFYRAFLIIKDDQNPLVSKRFNNLLNKLSEAKKEEISKIYIKKEVV